MCDVKEYSRKISRAGRLSCDSLWFAPQALRCLRPRAATARMTPTNKLHDDGSCTALVVVSIFPKSPSTSPLIPAVKYTALGSDPFPPFPRTSSEPQAAVHNRLIGSIPEGAEKSTGRRIEGVDGGISEISYQQIIAEAAEGCRSEGNAPRRIERSIGYQPLHEDAIEIEDVNNSKPGARRPLPDGRQSPPHIQRKDRCRSSECYRAHSPPGGWDR